MSCIENIISVKDVCGGTDYPSLSGLDLMDAPEISTNTLANIANEEYRSGLELAKKKVTQAGVLFRNDLMTVLASSGVLPNLVTQVYNTGTFKDTTTFPAESKERGLTLYKNNPNSSALRKTVIHNVKIYPVNSKDGATLTIYDDYAGGTLSTYTVNLTGSAINEIAVEYEVKGTYARVVLEGTGISMYSSYLTYCKTCSGSPKNDCCSTKGSYDGRETANKEGFGISLDFSCKCDYDEFICGLSATYIGEIVWLKARTLLMEEHLRSNRLNNWMVYNREETKQYLVDVENQYREKWNGFVNALPNILKSYHDSCLDCRGTRWVVNV